MVLGTALKVVQSSRSNRSPTLSLVFTYLPDPTFFGCYSLFYYYYFYSLIGRSRLMSLPLPFSESSTMAPSPWLFRLSRTHVMVQPVQWFWVLRKGKVLKGGHNGVQVIWVGSSLFLNFVFPNFIVIVSLLLHAALVQGTTGGTEIGIMVEYTRNGFPPQFASRRLAFSKRKPVRGVYLFRDCAWCSSVPGNGSRLRNKWDMEQSFLSWLSFYYYTRRWYREQSEISPLVCTVVTGMGESR